MTSDRKERETRERQGKRDECFSLSRASRFLRAITGVALLALFSSGAFPAPVIGQQPVVRPVKVTMDFNDVDLPVFVRFMSELTGRQFVLDEKATGKITVYSPAKVTVDQAYDMFLAALEVRRLTVVPKGHVFQITQIADFPPERAAFVYRLKHAAAADVATVLTNLVARSLAPPVAPGGRPPLRPSSEFEAPVQVFADKPSNSLVVSATRGDYERLKSVIQDLDTRRKQIFVEAVIMEVSVDRLRSIGTDPTQVLGLLSKGSLNLLGGLNRAPEDLATLAQALTGTTTGTSAIVANTINVRVFMQLLMNLADTNLLSTPQIMASDNQKSKIVVGQNVPFPTGQAQGITGGTLVTIERKDVGVTLEMTPQVLEGDLVRLEIKQEITAVLPGPQTIGVGNASVPVGPTTTKRALETITVAKDEQTLVVGGLVREDVVITEDKVPFLGDIPLLGWLFKTRSTQTTKVNLLVFLTPHILKDEVDMVKLNAAKGAEVELTQQDTMIEVPTAMRKMTAERLLSAEPPLSSEDRRDVTPPGPR
jgi:general secretion pathway protein D